MPRKPKPAVMRQVLVRLPVDMHAALKARAEAADRNMAQEIRRALRAYLEGR